MDSHCLLVVCSGGSREGDRVYYLWVWIHQQDVESVIGPFTLMKAALYATEMQLTLKITLDIAR